jgi:hypothetical protein
MFVSKYTITNSILRHIGIIDASREVINHAPLIPAWEAKFRKDAMERFVHHGTRLEGNALSDEEVKDILDGEDLFVTLATHLQFISTYEVGRVICELFKQNMENQIYNCGGMGSVSVGEMFCILNNICKIRPEAKKQEYEMGVQKLHNLVRLKHSKEYLINYANEK